MEWLANIGTLNLGIVGAVVLAALWIVARNFKTLKVGKAELTRRDDALKDSRTIMVEVMDFTWKVNSELTEGEDFYKKQARREIKDELYKYSLLLKTEYLSALRAKQDDGYRLTYSCVAATLDGQCYMKMLQLFMDLYEHNHISRLTETELKGKASEVYGQCTSIFKEHFTEPWLEEMCDYDDLRAVCERIAPSVEEMCLRCLKAIQECLRQLYALRTAIQNIRNATSLWIIERGLLPAEATGLAENFFEPNKGLNVDNVNKYLGLVKM